MDPGILLLRDGAGWLLPRIGFMSKHCYILSNTELGPQPEFSRSDTTVEPYSRRSYIPSSLITRGLPS